MAKSGRRLSKTFLIYIILATLFGCGGGGPTETSSGSESLPPKILSWQPPTKFLDNSPLDPVKDLSRFEIFINKDGVFSEADNEMAAVSAADSASGQVATTFNLANLAPFL